MREKLTLSMSMQDIAIAMSEGNPGALSVIMPILRADMLLLLSMDDMNIRGPQVWVGFKDYCGEDIEKFMQCLRARDQAMVDTINKECIYDNDFGRFDEVAVANGGSWDHNRASSAS